jgi:hypothetical protein
MLCHPRIVWAKANAIPMIPIIIVMIVSPSGCQWSSGLLRDIGADAVWVGAEGMVSAGCRRAYTMWSKLDDNRESCEAKSQKA